MANPSPYKARMARKKGRSRGSLEELQATLWYAIGRASEHLESDDPPTVFRAVNAIAQATAPYLKALEIGELEARLAALETAPKGGV